MEASGKKSSTQRRILLTALVLLCCGTLLHADPEYITSAFEDDIVEDVEGINTISGVRGNQSFVFLVEYSSDIQPVSLGKEDLQVIGESGEADGKELNVEFEWSFFQGGNRVGRYKIGPLDASANGIYSIKIVEGQVTGPGNPTPSVPAGEIFSFNQDITWPTPEILKVHPIEIMDEPVTGEESPFILEGPYGYAKAVLKIDFNKEIDTTSLWSAQLDIIGTSGEANGKTIPANYFSATDEGDYYTAIYNLGRLDALANGDYSIQIGEDQIKSIGELEEDKISLPAGDIAVITQNITNPPPGIRYTLDNALDVEYFSTITENFSQITVYYNLTIDPESIDQNDLLITGVSPGNQDQELKIEPNPFYRIEDHFNSQGTISATYILEGGLTEANNGDWKVELKANEIFDKNIPPNAAAVETIGILKTAVIDEFRVHLEGRIYMEAEGTTPSLIDDGWETDYGLPISYNTILESPPNGGVGFQNISFNEPELILFDDLPLVLSHPITGAEIGDAQTGGFMVAGKQELFFGTNHTFTVSGSGVNDGTYTVSFVSYEQSSDTTTVKVNEKVTSDLGEGIITKGPYTAEIVVDGGEPVLLSFTADELSTLKDLLDGVNEQLTDQALLFKLRTDTLRIESCSYGLNSLIVITEPEDGSGLFESLGAYTEAPVAGSLDWDDYGGNDYIPPDEFEDEEDHGRLQITVPHPGIHRVHVTFGSVYSGENDEFGIPINIPVAVPPQYAIQAVGDPNREGEPKDHRMYLHLKRDQNGETFTVNFSYMEEFDPPFIEYDEVQVLAGSKGNRLNVLANDGSPPGNNEDLNIVGLSTWLDPALLQKDPPPPTELQTGSQGLNNKIWTDGNYVYYDSPGFYYELIYYVIEDSQGRRDFEEIKIENVFEIRNQFAANDDFASILDHQERIQINLLANDSLEDTVSRDQMRITEVSETTHGGTVIFNGTDLTYIRPKGPLESDSFTYTMTDDYSGTDTATVTIITTDLPYSFQNFALSNLIMRLLSINGSPLAALIFRHHPELNYLVLNQRLELQADKQADTNGPPQGMAALLSAGTEETEMLFLDFWEALKPGIMAILTGNGDSVQVTEDIINEVHKLVDTIVELASPELKADLQALSDDTNNFEDFLGMNFDQVAESFNVDLDSIALPTVDIRRQGDEVKITTWDALGLIFKLWKNSGLNPNNWTEVDDLRVEQAERYRTLTDPNPTGDRVFYKITSELE